MLKWLGRRFAPRIDGGPASGQTKSIKGRDNKFAIVGFNTKGNPIEVMYNIVDSGNIQVSMR